MGAMSWVQGLGYGVSVPRIQHALLSPKLTLLH